MSHINLLPWREAARQRKQNQYVAALGVVGFIALIVMLGVNSYYNSLIENQNKRNQYLRNEIAVLDSKITEIKELKSKRISLEQRMGLIADLQRNRNLGAQIMDELVNVVPPGIYLIDLEKTDSKVTLKGKTESNNRVSTMMRQIEDSYLLEAPLLNAIVAAKTEEARVLSDFSMSLKVKATQLARDEGTK